MAKFKVGDRVRVVGNSTLHCFKIGEIVRMVSEDKFEYLNGSDWWLMNEDDYEAVEPEPNAPLSVGIDISEATEAMQEFADACERAAAALERIKEILK